MWTGSGSCGLVGDRPWDRLADPPGRVGRELVAAAPVELLDRPVQPDRALLDQVEQRKAVALVALGDRDDQPQVGVDHPPLGRHVAALDALREDLVGGPQQRHAADCTQVEAQRVEAGIEDQIGCGGRLRPPPPASAASSAPPPAPPRQLDSPAPRAPRRRPAISVWPRSASSSAAVSAPLRQRAVLASGREQPARAPSRSLSLRLLRPSRPRRCATSLSSVGSTPHGSSPLPGASPALRLAGVIAQRLRIPVASAGAPSIRRRRLQPEKMSTIRERSNSPDVGAGADAWRSASRGWVSPVSRRSFAYARTGSSSCSGRGSNASSTSGPSRRAPTCRASRRWSTMRSAKPVLGEATLPRRGARTAHRRGRPRPVRAPCAPR